MLSPCVERMTFDGAVRFHPELSHRRCPIRMNFRSARRLRALPKFRGLPLLAAARVWEGRVDPNKEGAMRRLIFTVLLAAGVLIVSPVADAAAPSFRDRIDDTYEIEDFCGTGVTVQAHEVTTAQGWETDTTIKVSFNSRTTYTYGDRSVSDHWAGRSDGVLVEGDLDGAHTEFFRRRGCAPT